MTNKHNTTLYTGITNNIRRRVFEHQEGQGCQFTRRYHCMKLLYAEEAPDSISAIEREKEIKGWKRSKKATLISTFNPKWEDLSSVF